MGYIAKLWRGEECLVVTYWVFGTVILWSLAAIASQLTTALSRAGNASAGGVSLVLAYHLATFAYTFFAWVAVWRSASRYRGWRGWPILAKTVVAIGVVGVAAGVALGVARPDAIHVLAGG